MQDIGNGYLLEDDSGRWLLEDGSGVWLQESAPTTVSLNNYQFIRVTGDGMSVTEKIR